MRKIYLFILFFIFLTVSIFAQSAIDRANSLSITEKGANIQISFRSKTPLEYSLQKENGGLGFLFKSINFDPKDLQLYPIDRGIVDSVKISNRGGDALIFVKSMLPPVAKIEFTSLPDGQMTLIKIAYAAPKKSPFRAIKRKNDYRAGVSQLQDYVVMVDAFKKPTARPNLFEKVKVADIKKGKKENIALITSGVNPSIEKSSAKYRAFMPIEKSSNIKISFSNRPIPEILKILASKTNKNIIIAPSVTGDKSVEFKDITPEEAMINLLKGTPYQMKIVRNTIIVGSSDSINSLSRSALISNEATKKIVCVLKNIRGEKIIQELKQNFPNVKYIFHPNLNAFELEGYLDELEEVERFLDFNDSKEN